MSGRPAPRLRAPRVIVAFAAVVGLLGSVAPVVRAADPVTFQTPTATSTFQSGVTFSQPVSLSATPARVELLLTLPGALGPLVLSETAPTSTGTSTLRDSFGGAADGSIRPNTLVSGRWRITWKDGTASLGPSIDVRYADDRFDWKTQNGDIVRVHWYAGDAAFGKRALAIGEQAVAKAEALLGVTETEPIDFFIYADQTAFYDALGPGTPENVGGEAHADIRTMFANITPSGIDDSWVGIVIPHELTHLVFDTATSNVYHQPPRWLNEGLAVYLSQGYDDSDRQLVRQAARSGGLMPLDGLVSGFPRDRDGFYLAYAESVAAIDFLVRTYGQDALVTLIRSYADGTSDDAAFTSALGIDTAAFNAAWFADVGAPVPSPLGPQPDVVGPLPPGWAAPSGAPMASPSPGQPAPASPAASTGPETSVGGVGGASSTTLLLLAGLLAVVLVLAVAVVTLTRRRRAVAEVASGWQGTVVPPVAPAPTSTGTDEARPAPSDPEQPATTWSSEPSPWARPVPSPSPRPLPPPPDATAPSSLTADDTPGPGGPSDGPDR